MIKEFFERNKGKEFIGIDTGINYCSIKIRVKYEHKGYHYEKK